MVGVFADVTSEAVSEHACSDLLEENRPDLLVYEGMNVGAGVAAGVLGIPAAAYAIGLTHMGYAMIHPAAIGYHRELWTDRGQQPPDGHPLLGQGPAGPHAPVAAQVQRSLRRAEDSDPAGRVRGVDRRRAGLARGTPVPAAGSI